MEACTADRHVAVVENCVMTQVGFQAIITCCSSSSYRLHTFNDSSEWFSQNAYQRYDIVIYSVAGLRHSRQQSIHFLSHLAQVQPDSVRVLLAENEIQAKLIHHLSPVPLHAVLCKSSSVEKLQIQVHALMHQKASQNAPRLMHNSTAHSVCLSPTERTMLYYLGKGFSISEIAVRMSRNPKTIRTHKFNAMNKLGVKSDKGLLCAADILRYLPLQTANTGW